MKAAVLYEYGGPEKLRIEEIDEPVVEKSTDIKIKVLASSINPVDWKIRIGNHKYTLGSHFPIILGFDACGEIVETGNEVTRFKVGDIVYGRLNRKYGRAYAEFAVASENVFDHKPQNISIEEAAASPLAALTALQALRDKGNIKKDSSVLINGASGGVGCFAVQVAKLLGGECWAVASKRHFECLEKMNPDKLIDYTESD
ncbi:MAG: zinc-binding alcohol dehydrogenase, partial [Marinilabiliales bacterium]